MWEMNYNEAADYWIKRDAESEKMDAGALMTLVEEYIKANNTCALATASEDLVRCTPIEYNYIDGIFYLFSEGGLKFRGLKENRNVGLAVYGSYEGFGKLRSLQVTGTAEMVEPFSDEYLKVMEFRKIPLEVMKKLDRPMNLIKVTPSCYDYLDSELKKSNLSSRQHLDVPEGR